MSRAYGTPIPQTIDGPTGLDFAESQCLRFTVPGEYIFRVESVSYSTCVLDVSGGENYGSTEPRLELFALQVLRWTEYGATLHERVGVRNRWVDLRPGKQYASRTAREAVEQFAERRKRQIYILHHQLARAKQELDLTKPCVLAPPA